MRLIALCSKLEWFAPEPTMALGRAALISLSLVAYFGALCSFHLGTCAAAPNAGDAPTSGVAAESLLLHLLTLTAHQGAERHRNNIFNHLIILRLFSTG